VDVALCLSIGKCLGQGFRLLLGVESGLGIPREPVTLRGGPGDSSEVEDNGNIISGGSFYSKGDLGIGQAVWLCPAPMWTNGSTQSRGWVAGSKCCAQDSEQANSKAGQS
jgi:hypothetical protein